MLIKSVDICIDKSRNAGPKQARLANDWLKELEVYIESRDSIWTRIFAWSMSYKVLLECVLMVVSLGHLLDTAVS